MTDNSTGQNGPTQPAGPTQTPEPTEPTGPTGAELARETLARARAAARRQTDERRATPVKRRRAPSRDRSDPVKLGDALTDLIACRGWDETVQESMVLARWEELVGPDIGGHAHPESITAGKLVVVADSPVWATQLRMLTRTMKARFDSEIAPGIVTEIVVKGPTTSKRRR